MLYYVSHLCTRNPADLYRIRAIVSELQLDDLENCYLCPAIVFSHLTNKDIPFDEEMELRLDLLSACDTLVVIPDIGRKEKREMEYAEMVGMEVLWLEEYRTL